MGAIIVLLTILLFSNCIAQTGETGGKSIEELKAEYSYFENNTIPIVQNDTIPHRHTAINLAGQVLLGSGLAAGFSFLPLVATFAITWNNESPFLTTTLSIVTVSSYIFGAALGVRTVARHQNPNLSLWKTFGYATIGAGTGVLVTAVLATKYETIPPAGGAFLALSPLIGSIVYASFIADWDDVNGNEIQNQEPPPSQPLLTHKDLIEQSKLVDIELFRIKF